MEPLTPAKDGFTFTLGRLCVDINYARTWQWSEDNKRESHIKRNTYYFSVHKVERTDYPGLSVLLVVLGPIKFQVGIA